MPATHNISDFSPHLFWDVNRDGMSFEQNKDLIIHRVLEYGLLKDWKIIVKMYGIPEIAKTATQYRSLDAKALSFISHLSKMPKNKFRCYTTKPLHKKL